MQIADMFALWIASWSAMALCFPSAFTWIGGFSQKALLSLLVFFMGMTARPTEFAACFANPRPIFINAFLCLCAVPALAYVLASSAGLQWPFKCGLVLLGSVNGGSSSNLFSLLAGADVALSIVMTASTTLLAVMSIPTVAKAMIGTMVPVDGCAILLSAVQLVLLPVTLGVCASLVLPKTSAAVERGLPVFGLLVVAPITGSVVGGSAKDILEGGVSLHAAVAVLHAVSAATGYGLSSALGGSEKECRTVAIEVGMKNAVFSSVLAATHFSNPAIKAPSAVSCIWCPMVAAMLSAYWKARPVSSKAALSESDVSADVRAGA